MLGSAVNSCYNKFLTTPIDGNTFQCLTCNTLSTMKGIDIHTKDSIHEENMKKCNIYYDIYISSINNNEIYKKSVGYPVANCVCSIVNTDAKENSPVYIEHQENNDTSLNNNKKADDSTSEESDVESSEYFEAEDESIDINGTQENNQEKILNSVIYFAKNEININFETEMGYCKKCSENIAFDFYLISEHIKRDKQSNKIRVIRDYVPYECDVNKSRKEIVNEVLKADIKDEAEDESIDINGTQENNQEKILNSVIYFAKNEININFETEMGYCKKCSENIAFDFYLISEHIKRDKQSNKIRVIRDYVPYECDVNKSRKEIVNEVLKADIKDTRPICYRNANDELQLNEGIFQNNAKLNNKCLNEENITMNSENALNNAEVNATASHVKSANKYLDEVTVNSDSDLKNASPCASALNEDIDPKSYAEKNYLSYNKTNNNAYCHICLARIPASSLKSIKEHVNGMRHKKNTLRKKIQDKPLTMSLRRFVEGAVMIKLQRYMFLVVGIEYVFIKQKYCLSGESYNLILKRGMRLRCILCEQIVNKDDIYVHSESRDHIQIMMTVPVVITLKDEFVREIGRSLYHCGFCNLILSNWEELQKHLHCVEHNDAKSIAKTILLKHMPALKNLDK